ncbi:MAG: GAF domain-containing protein, partial [Candidatus Riflebacteria bacterium]|nr:GAF domain-containing protein [Candidatus Riflebacteria bacterium]
MASTIDPVRPTLTTRLASWCAWLLQERSFALFVVLFVGGQALMGWRFWGVLSSLIETLALQQAQGHSVAIEEARNVYSSEVVARVLPKGITISHSYGDIPGAIPVPPAFTAVLGKSMARRVDGLGVRLFGDTGMEGRSAALRPDRFEAKALRELRQNPTGAYHSFEDVNGEPVFRFATAQTMQASCVGCHNSNPNSPRKDWRVGDVAGFLEVTVPLHQVAGASFGQLRDTMVATGGLTGILLFSILVLSTRRLRGMSSQLQLHVDELRKARDDMEAEVRERTAKLSDQDWLKTNVARIAALLHGVGDVQAAAKTIITELPPLVDAAHGVFFVEGSYVDRSSGEQQLQLLASYAYQERKNLSCRFKLGEGLVGQCALERRPILLTRVPSDYVRIASGLGEAPPLNIVVYPVVYETRLVGVLELASFTRFTPLQQQLLDALSSSVGIIIENIAARARTEVLLKESQTMTLQLQDQAAELQAQQEELRQSNEELQETSRQNEEQNERLKRAGQELEQKAAQLALSSRYKSEFLANMSHELRTPLNSMLILAKLLADNGEGTLTGRQSEFARTIHSSGMDLLGMINDILDMAKIEAGRMDVTVETVALGQIVDQVERTFRPMALERNLQFEVERAEALPDVIRTDEKRLMQVLKNLLANAFKFTHAGHVSLRIGRAPNQGAGGDNALDGAPWVAFAVTDTGIGIPADRQQAVFEPFQQADGTTSRSYGGTGLGLAICRQIAGLLGGSLTLRSEMGKGSTFTLVLPRTLEESSGPTRRPSAHGAPPDAALLESGAAAPETGPGIAGKMVLVVDDDARNVVALTALLREQKMRTCTASNGKEALRMLDERPDVV